MPTFFAAITRIPVPVLVLFLLLAPSTKGQELTQTVRGTLMDKVSNTPLIGATVVILESSPLLGASTNENGTFKIENVPVGKHAVRITYLGYLDLTLPSVMVNSGKEVVLELQMEEDIEVMQAVEIVGNDDKKEANNNMSTVSTRTFSVEETQKFAAAVNDPGRMAISFAGVVSPDDGGNKISVRGNSPFGLLWRMEGIDIPNPNHFAVPASSGGGISILNAQTLSNSDFMTSAFPAEYGNALSAVFDLRLRRGNNEKREYTISAGFLGTEVAAEGPFKKGYDGSYLVNYRYSTLSILSEMGVNVGSAINNFQDITYNIYLPTNKMGTFELFGFGGLSSSVENAVRDTTEWEYSWQGYDSKFISNTGAAGFKHLINLSDRIYLQSSAMISGNNAEYHQDKLEPDFSSVRDFDELNNTSKFTLSSVLNHKIDTKNSMRSGIYVNRLDFTVYQKYLNYDTDQFETQLDASGDHYTVQVFSQWKHRLNKQITLNSGIHVLTLPVNQTYSIEPRLAAKYEAPHNQTFSLGYGLHSQTQSLGIYEAQVLQADGTYIKPNKDLKFNRAHHFVAGYQKSITEHMYVKTEVYYQHLFDVAVGAEEGSTLSVLNNEENYITDPLVNNGYGKNYGVELTVEQFTHNDLYFLLSGSLYESKYQADDGIWRNTRYNGNYSVSFTGGKEIAVGNPEKHRTLGMNARLLFAGGLRETPIDFEESVEHGYTKYYEDRAYEDKMKDYFRLDLRVSLRRNRPNSTTTLALDVQNATNRQNIYRNYFEPDSGTIRTSYQVPLIPVLSYKIEF